MKTKIPPKTIEYFDQLLKDVPELIWQASTLREAVEQGTKLGEEQGEKRGIELGEKRGIELGEQRGIELGKKRKEREIARTMLLKGMDISLVAELTDLEEEEVRSLLL